MFMVHHCIGINFVLWLWMSETDEVVLPTKTHKMYIEEVKNTCQKIEVAVVSDLVVITAAL